MADESNRKCFITGDAGLIGSDLADRLPTDAAEVVVYDDFSTGQREFFEQAPCNTACRLIEGHALDESALAAAMQGCDCVFHLAANAAIPSGLEDSRRDPGQNTLAAFNVPEVMRKKFITQMCSGANWM